MLLWNFWLKKNYPLSGIPETVRGGKSQNEGGHVLQMWVNENSSSKTVGG